jgi:hypothetical protein
MGAAASPLGPVHPRGVARAHHGFAVDVDRGAFQLLGRLVFLRLASQLGLICIDAL